MRAIILASTALVLAIPVAAQTVQERLEKARTEVNATENAAARALYRIDRGEPDKARTEINATKNAASRALYAIDQALKAVVPVPPPPPPPVLCPDGSTVPAGQACPIVQPPPPPPPPPPVLCPDGSTVPAGQSCPVVPPPPPPPPVSLTGLPPIASNFDFNTALITTGQIPPSGKPDVVGAFRFICGAGQLSYDDPILYPGQPGKSHLHQYYGNVTANAHSTYASLRAAGDSTCNWTGTGNAANRSGYWMPAMLDGKGNVVRPDYVSIYYKQRPQSDPTVSNPSASQYLGKAIQLPNGIKFIFGWDPTGKNIARTGSAYFNCQGPTSKPGHYQTLVTALNNCAAGNQVGAVIEAPDCWDGKQLDSADHRSHVAYSTYGSWGYLKCPSTHPYNIPTFTLGAWYTVAAGDNTALWSLSSDMMAPGQPTGHTFHADFFMAWDPPVHDMWWQNCIAKLLNCSGGQLGNGRDLKGAAAHNRKSILPTRLVPVP